MKRSIIGIILVKAFFGLSVTGIWLFLFPFDEKVVILHVLLAGLFLLIASTHIAKNIPSIKAYTTKHITAVITVLLLAVMVTPLIGRDVAQQFVSLYTRFQQRNLITASDTKTVYQLHEDPNLSIELRAGKHFWFPQIAVWATDTAGNYLETLFVTNSTAKGEFFGGRTKENFKEFDETQQQNFEYRRVDALPFWSEQYGVLAKDGRYAPAQENPLPDAISGATPDGSLLLETKIPDHLPYQLMVELNVAFDDNRYYSQYDFPEDTAYHSGTGLLGQPSVVYATKIYPGQSKKHYLLEYMGHTHPSKYEPLAEETQGLTTALEILDLGLISIHQ